VKRNGVSEKEWDIFENRLHGTVDSPQIGHS
jgi:hypothetical protein